MIKFTDVRPFKGSETYAVPNECLVTLRKLTENDIPPCDKGGSIASGGEVPLTVVLPLVNSLQIVDHNYGSLMWTCFKILFLKHFNNKALREMLTTAGGFSRAIQELSPENPLITGGHSILPSPAFQSSIVSYWHSSLMPDKILDAARERLDEVEVVHGDLRDIGPNLDLLYISNALGHNPHDGSKESLQEKLAAVMKSSGTIIATCNNTIIPDPKGCPTVKVLHPTTNRGMQWKYILHRVVARPTVTERFRYMVSQEQKVLHQKIYDSYWGNRLVPINIRAFPSRIVTPHQLKQAK